jgi:hypothetical protein
MGTASPWDRFAETVLVFGGDEPVEVGVHAGLEPAAIGRLMSLGLGDRFAVITPCNPLGVTLEGRSNAERLTAFRAELDQLGIRSVEADGWSPNRTHVERGNACALDLPAALMLARKWQQLALFWFDGQRILLVPVPLVNTSERSGHLPDYQPSSDA